MYKYSPMLEATVLLALGIWIGDAFPLGISYLFLCIAAIALASLFRRRKVVCTIALLSVWFLLGAARSQVSFSPVEDAITTLQHHALHTRERLLRRLASSGLDEDAFALCASMALGEKQAVSHETRQLFNLTGTGHLLAISGLHVGAICSILHFLFIGRMPHRWQMRLGIPLMLAVVWAYAFVVGLTPSIVRTVIMLTLWFLLYDKSADVLYFERLLLCVFLMLLFSPDNLYNLGFWLSSTAVAGIILIYLPAKEYWYYRYQFEKKRVGFAQSCCNTLCLGLVTQVSTLPLCIYCFHSIPLLGPLCSFFLIPFAVLGIYCTFILIIVPWPELATILNVSIDYTTQVMQWLTDSPATVISWLYPTMIHIILLYAFYVLCICAMHTYITRHSPIEGYEWGDY